MPFSDLYGMNLLEDIALFDEGRKRFTNFQLPDTDNGYAWTDVPLEIKARVEGEYGTRLFKVRHKTGKDLPQLSIPLTHGSFLLMGETMQQHYEHHVPKTSRKIGARINLTFRISETA